LSSGFNATTAFLLLIRILGGCLAIVAFQCHHGVPASPHAMPDSRVGQPFQCHHGVPASRSSGERPVASNKFQCHHGVPASEEVHQDLARNIPVSMPPRRSCFIGHSLIVGTTTFGFNATTAFLLPYYTTG